MAGWGGLKSWGLQQTRLGVFQCTQFSHQTASCPVSLIRSPGSPVLAAASVLSPGQQFTRGFTGDNDPRVTCPEITTPELPALGALWSCCVYESINSAYAWHASITHLFGV